MDNQKRQLNVKLITIIVLVLILLSLLATAGYLLLNEDKNPEENIPENTEKTNNNSEEEQAKDVFYNIFLITYILEGDVKVGDGKLTINDDDEPYYAVSDYLLNDIHSLSDINKLIDDNLLDAAAVRTRKIMESSYANQYTYNEDILYVKKTKDPCKNVAGGEPDKNKTEYGYR